MAGLVAVFSLSLLGIAPQDAGVLGFTRVTINNSAGDQYDPHVDGDLSAYSDATPSQIRYYRFSNGVDDGIPNVAPDGTPTFDLLSDVSQGRIVFTRVLPDRNAIMLFDVATLTMTELAASAGSNRQGVALGAQTVAFADFGLDPNGEIVAVDLSTNTTTRLTNDAEIDRLPAVSEDGATIAWEHCTTGCAIWKATRGPTGWVVSTATATAESNTNPDATNTTIVYESIRAGATGPDLFTTPVGGGPETRIAIAGDEYNPSIRGDIIAFEHRDPAATLADLYVYDRANNRLFQITNTPTIAESLNDVTILADGSIRVVWEARDDGTTRNIYGATFSLPAMPPPPPPPPPACQNRSSTLVASRTYSPSGWNDGVASFSPALGFALPSTLTVTRGNAGNQWATLTISNGRRTLECAYRGGAPTARPRNAAEVALGLTYRFFGCSAHGLAPGKIVSATGARLRVQSGDASRGTTEVTLSLADTCAAADWPRAGHGCGDHDDDRDDDREHD